MQKTDNTLELLEHLYKASNLPSLDQSRYWITERSDHFYSTDISGKWCVFVPKEDIDHIWSIIRTAVKEKKFICAKTATRLQSKSFGGSYVICVYTTDWQNQDEVFRIKDELVKLGITNEMKFKRDIDTMNGVERFVYE